MGRLLLDQGYSLWTLAVAAVVTMGLAALGYRRSFRHVVARRWRQLLGLRLAAIGLVLLLLFQPVARVESDVKSRRAILFAIDASASMAIVDDASGVSRFDQARRRLLDWSARLAREFDVRLVSFADQARRLERPSDLAALRADGTATSMTRALAAASRAAAPGEAVEAVVVVSDGIHNAAGDPVAQARRIGVPVHTVGVGSNLSNSPSYRDVSVTSVFVADQLPVNNAAQVKARLAQVGLPGRVVDVALEEDGKPVARRDVTLRPGDVAAEVDFEFVPSVKGRHTYNVAVARQADESIGENNHRAVVSQVVEARLRVLYIEGALRAEYGALVQRFFSKDPDIEFCALVRTRPGVFAQRTNRAGLDLKGIPTDPAVLGTFDVFVLGDLDSAAWPAGALDALVKRVRAGAGLLMIGGYHSLGPGGFASTPLAAILPVELGARDVGQVTEPFLPRLTPAGRGHPILANIARFFPELGAPPAVAGLPPLDGCVKVAAGRPGASILAVGPGSPHSPVLAVQNVGAGRTAVFTGDTTRNWQQAPRARDQESPFLRFWGQMLRWLANRAESAPTGASVVARADKAYYDPDVPIAVEAIVRDREGEAATQAEVRARVKGPRGDLEPVVLTASADAPGHYQGAFDPGAPGTYQITVDARVAGSTLEDAVVLVDVGRPNLEYDRLDLDERLLTRLAEATGGRYRHLSTADHLLDELDRDAQRRRVAWEQPLTWPPLFWAAFVGLLGIEWFLRQRCQLR